MSALFDSQIDIKSNSIKTALDRNPIPAGLGSL